MVWTLKSFCGLGHSAQPRLRRTWVTLLGHRSNSQHQDHHNLGRLHPWTFTGGKSHLQSVSTISGQTIFVDPLFLGWWLFSFVGLVPNAANYTQGPPTAWCPWCCQLQTACQQIPILMDQPFFLQLGLLGMLEWDLRPTIWLQLAMPLWLGKPSTSSLRNSLTLLPCLAKFPKNANVMGKSIFRLHKGREGCHAFPCQSHAWGNFRGR